MPSRGIRSSSRRGLGRRQPARPSPRTDCDRHVVGDAAGVEGVVEAVRDGVGGCAGPRSGMPRRRACELASWSGLREPDRHGLARRPGGHMEPRGLLARRAQVLHRTAGCPAGFLAQLLLGRERGIGAARGVPAAADPLAVERRGGLEVLELRCERVHAGICSGASRSCRRAAARRRIAAGGRPRAASSPATTSAAPATERPVIGSL